MADLEFKKPSKFHNDNEIAKTDIEKSRAEFGIAKQDTWCMHDYLFTVIRNGLTHYLQSSISWPGTEEFPEPEDWNNELKKIIFKIDWLLSSDDFSTDIFVYWYPERFSTNFEEWINRPRTEDDARYHEVSDAFYERKQQIYEEVMAWLTKWWYSLWD